MRGQRERQDKRRERLLSFERSYFDFKSITYPSSG
jgi:hypothetical protein